MLIDRFFHLPSAVLAACLCSSIPMESAVAAPCPAAPEAVYEARFEATWSRETHPEGFPTGPHFSGLIGGVHDATVRFWENGRIASRGIEQMAETGAKRALREEVESAISEGSAREVISGGGIGRSPAAVTTTLTVTQEYPLVSLVSMLAPSPDWFVGVHDLRLFESGSWMSEVVVELHVYDAGTDSGTDYVSPNADTQPPELIRRLTDPPFVDSGIVGTFTFTRVTPGQVCDAPPFVRGDANQDGAVTLSDAVHVLQFVFLGEDEPSCLEAADFTDDDELGVANAVALLGHLFLGGAPPPPPYPSCGAGTDPAEGLGCESFAPCEGVSL